MPNPTTPNADIRVVYRYLNTAVIRFGTSQYNDRYVVQIFKNGVSQGAWQWNKASAEVGDHCEVDLGQIQDYETEYATTYEMVAFSVNADGVESGRTTPATLTMAPELPSVNVYQSGNSVIINLNFTSGTPWTRVACNIQRDGIYTEQSFYIYAPTTSYSVVSLPENANYHFTLWSEYEANGVFLESKDINGETYTELRTLVFRGSRPNNFTWDSPKVTDGPYNLTAVEWNNYLSRLRAFSAYMAGQNWMPVYVNQNELVYAEYMNDVIGQLFLIGADNVGASDYVYPGNVIKASLLNKIVTEMNTL